MRDLEKEFNLEDKTDRELERFCFSVLGVYRSSCGTLKEKEEELKELIKYKYAEKVEINRLEDLIKKYKLKIETIEDLFEIYFSK
jgi:hypothetical protein